MSMLTESSGMASHTPWPPSSRICMKPRQGYAGNWPLANPPRQFAVMLSVPCFFISSRIARYTAPAFCSHSGVGSTTFSACFGPAPGPLGRLIAVRFFVQRLQFLEADVDPLGAQEFAFLPGGAGADDQESRFLQPPQALADLGQRDFVLRRMARTRRRQRAACGLFAASGKDRRCDVGLL